MGKSPCFEASIEARIGSRYTADFIEMHYEAEVELEVWSFDNLSIDSKGAIPQIAGSGGKTLITPSQKACGQRWANPSKFLSLRTSIINE
jgi:hypothetical protein